MAGCDRQRDVEKTATSRPQITIRAVFFSSYAEMTHRGLDTISCFDVWLATFHILEMLYDTPFPEMPQTNLVPEKAAWNAEIIALHKTGRTVVSIAKQFRISEQRVNQIIRGRRN
jgi:hypothetical protein